MTAKTPAPPCHDAVMTLRDQNIKKKAQPAQYLCALTAIVFAVFTPNPARAQPPSPAPATESACDPATNWQANLLCLNEKAVFVDIALQHSLKKLDDVMAPQQSAQLQHQQRQWLERRDKECTPTDRPASDSNALAYAMLCRSKMATRRTALLESMEPAATRQKSASERLCPKGSEASLGCLQKNRDLIENGVHMIYISTLLNLPELQADKLYTEQQDWEEQREKSCQLNGYVHEKEDQVVCQTRMALERVKVFKSDWQPLTHKEARP